METGKLGRRFWKARSRILEIFRSWILEMFQVADRGNVFGRIDGVSL